MDFASSTRAAVNGTRWKGIVANSSVVPRRPSKVMRYNRIESICYFRGVGSILSLLFFLMETPVCKQYRL